MQLYSYTQARQKFAEVLNASYTDDVIIRRRGGDEFKITPIKTKSSQNNEHSPLDVPGIKCNVSMDDIIDAIHKSHAHEE
jgi:prevent-host-death family protein